MNVPIFRDIASCCPHVNRRFGGTCQFYLQDRKSSEEETNLQQVIRQNSDRYLLYGDF
jgi:hypothetical protein